MARVFLGIGSNVNREQSILSSIKLLNEMFGELLISTVYESEAYGFEGENFYNLVVGIDTELSLQELMQTLRKIEDNFGRDRSAPRFSSRTLDIDLLLYGDLVTHKDSIDIPREDVSKYAFVLRPLAEIAGEDRHPETGETFNQIWKKFDQSSQKLWAVALNLKQE